MMEFETVSKAMDAIEGFPVNLRTVVQHLLISHHGQYEFGSPKLPMIREALAFHYLDDLDSNSPPPAPRSRSIPANPNGPPTAAPSAANSRLDQFLKSTSAKAEENVANPKLFQ